jgi:EmrB/QacA subfamily drug resistance transporter
MSSTATAFEPISESVHRRRWWILAVLCLSLLIVFVGNTSLNVTIPTLSRELNATEAQLQWVIAIYSLVFAGLLFSSGSVGDRFGRKGALQGGLIVFMAACVLATYSTEMWQLIGARALMGIGAAFIMPSTLSILVNVFPPDERTKAIAIWAGVTGGAGALGQVATGLILNHFWYGAVFLVNIPICLVALAAGFFLLPKSRDPEETRLDPVGAVLSIVGIVGIVYGLIEAPDKGWTSPATLIAFLVGVVVLTAFVLWELRQDAPMLDPRLFKNGAFSTGTGGMILVFMAMYGVMFLITQYFQLILGYTPLDSALRFLPMAPIMIIVAPLTPRISARIGVNRTVSLGLFMVAGSLLMLRALQVDTSYWYILLSIVPMVSGMALAMSPMTASIMSAVPPNRAGAGSAMNDASRELGAALGVAVMGSLAASQYASAITSLTAGLPSEAQEMASRSLAGALRVAGEIGGAAGQALKAGADAAFVDGVHLAVVAGAVLSAAAAALVLKFLPRVVVHEGAMHGAVEAMEDVAELGLAGAMPVFPDDPRPGGQLDDDRDDRDDRDGRRDEPVTTS